MRQIICPVCYQPILQTPGMYKARRIHAGRCEQIREAQRKKERRKKARKAA